MEVEATAAAVLLTADKVSEGRASAVNIDICWSCASVDNKDNLCAGLGIPLNVDESAILSGEAVGTTPHGWVLVTDVHDLGSEVVEILLAAVEARDVTISPGDVVATDGATAAWPAISHVTDFITIVESDWTSVGSKAADGALVAAPVGIIAAVIAVLAPDKVTEPPDIVVGEEEVWKDVTWVALLVWSLEDVAESADLVTASTALFLSENLDEVVPGWEVEGGLETAATIGLGVDLANAAPVLTAHVTEGTPGLASGLTGSTGGLDSCADLVPDRKSVV